MDRPYTMQEAAGELRVSRRKLQEIVKRHPHYYPNGHKKLFTEDDLEAIVAGLRREAAQERERSLIPSRVKSAKPPVKTAPSALTELQQRLAKPRR